MGHNDTTSSIFGISARQESLLPFLAKAHTISEAAVIGNVSRSTLYRWLRDDRFREALTRARAGFTLTARLRVHTVVFQSLQALLESTRDPDPAIRIRAARSALQFARQFGEWDNLQESLRTSEDSLPAWVARCSEESIPPSPSPYDAGEEITDLPLAFPT